MLFISLLLACSGGDVPAEASADAPTEEVEVPNDKANDKTDADAVADAPEDTRPPGKSSKGGNKGGKGANGGTAGAPMCQMMRAQFERAFGLTPSARETADCEWEYKATLADMQSSDAAWSPHASLDTLHEALMSKGWTEFTEGSDAGDDSYTYSRGNLVMKTASEWSPVDKSCDKTPVDCKTDPASVDYTLSLTIHAAQ